MRRIIIQLFSVGVMALIAYQLYEYARDAEAVGTKTIVLEWPLAAVSFAVAGLSVVSLVMQVLGLVLARESHGGEDLGSRL